MIRTLSRSRADTDARRGIRLWLWLWLTLAAQAQPDNDLFIHRQPLSGNSAQFTAYFLDATLESGEPSHPILFGAPTRSVWYAWTAPIQGFARIRSSGWTGEPAAVAVYSGPSLAELTLVGQANPITSSAYFPVAAGREYHLAAFNYQNAGFSGPAEAEFELELQPPVVNDNFAQRILLQGHEIRVQGFNVGATRESDEPTFMSDPPEHTVWWSWTAPGSGTVTVTFSNQDFEARAAVFTGPALGQLSLVAKTSAISPLPLNFQARPGETYHFLIGSPAQANPGRFTWDLVLSSWRLTAPTEGAQLTAPGQVTFQWVDAPTNSLLRNIQAISQEGYLGWWPELSPAGLTVENLRAGSYAVQLMGIDASHRIHVTPAVNFTVALVNDSFAQRLPLKGTTLDVTGTLAGATVEPGEPGSEPSVWWTWVPPITGRAVITFQGGARFNLFTGITLASLQPTPPAMEDLSRVEFDVVGGVPVHIRAGAKYAWSTPDFHLELREYPPNDTFAHRIRIATNRIQLTIPIGLAEVDSTEPAVLAGPDHATVWYTWTAPGEGALSFGGGASDGYFGYAVFTGNSVGSLQTFVAPNFGSAGPFFDPVPGQTYQIALIGHRSNPGTLTFILDFRTKPPNDHFVNAEVLQGPEGQRAGNNELATLEPGEPPHLVQPTPRSVWYTWTAPHSGFLEVSTITQPPPSYAFDPVVAIYRGSNLTDLVLLGSGFASTNNPVFADVEAGQTYRLAVAGTSYSPNSDFQLSWLLHDRPANDAFANRIVIEGLRASFPGETFGATREPQEPTHGGAVNGRSVWWSWTAPHTGWVTVTALGIHPSPSELWIYEGDALGNLKWVGSSVAPLSGLNLSTAIFEANAGKTYQLALDSHFGQIAATRPSGGSYALNLDLSTLRMTSPVSGVTYPFPNVIPLELGLPSPAVDGQLTTVDFWSLDVTAQTLGESLGGVTQPPFRIVRTNLPPAHYLVAAVATNTAGELRVSLPTPFTVKPVNDDFAARIPLTGRSLVVRGTAAGGGREPGEPIHTVYFTNAPTVWYSWIAPANGRVSFFTLEGGSDSIRVYRGNALPQLTVLTNEASASVLPASRGERFEIAVQDLDPRALAPGYTNGFTLQIRLETLTLVNPSWGQHIAFGAPLVIEAATTENSSDLAEVEFRVDGVRIGAVSSAPYRLTWNSTLIGEHQISVRTHLTSGEFSEEVSVTVTVSPPNDFFATREMISGANAVFRGNTRGASAEVGEPFAAQSDIWFAWRAPASGLLILDGKASSYTPRVGIYRGTSLPTLVLLADNILNFPHSLPGDPLAVSVVGGGDYAVVVDALNGQTGPIEFSLVLLQPPPNDHFENRTVLTGSSGDASASLRLATVQPGEPIHEGIGTQRTAWWTWTAPASGALAVTTSTGGALAFGAYTGTTLATLATVPAQRVTGGFQLNVQAGVTYHLAFSDFLGSVGELSWHFQLYLPPANDDFASRLPLSGRRVRTMVSLLGATREVGEPLHFAAPGFGSVWWSWTPPTHGRARLQVTAFGVETLVGVYQGTSLAQLTQVSSGTTSAQFEAIAGTPYQIAVDRAAANSGEIQLELTLDYPPDNDDFANRLLLQDTEITALGWNTLAGREFGEPWHADRFGGRSVWYSWRAPEAGTVTLHLTSAFWPSLIASYRGSSLSELVPIAAQVGGTAQIPFGFQGTNQLQFAVAPETDYALAVDGQLGASGEFTLKLHFARTASPFQLTLEPSAPGQLQLTVDGLAGRIAEIQTSTDLVVWTPLVTTPANAVSYRYDVPFVPEQPARFYRAVERNP